MATRPPQIHEPTVWQKLKMGALMGGGVGLTIGFVFGSYSILRQGAGPRGILATLSQYMISSAATFSFFLAIGSVIRSDSAVSPYTEGSYRNYASPIIQSRVAGANLISARWKAEKLRQQRHFRA